jgi:hypothetical protein
MRLRTGDRRQGAWFRQRPRPASRGAEPLVLHVEKHGEDWEIVEPPDPAHEGRIRCETLDEARRVAYLSVAHRRPCTLIVRESAGHEHRELIGADGAAEG